MTQIGLAIDALSPELTGIGRYTWELCSRLPARAELDEVRYYRYGRWFDDPAWFLQRRRPPRSIIPPFISRQLAKKRFKDVLLHSPNFLLPVGCERGVVTVHDLSVIRFPHLHPIERVLQFERNLMNSIDKASHVITVSRFIAQELTSLTGIPPGKISPIHLGISSNFLSQLDAPQTASTIFRYGLEAQNYCLCVSTLEPRKGLDLAIEAFTRYVERTGEKFKLAIIGASGWKNCELHNHISRAVSKGLVTLLGYVAEADLPALYRGARLFLYPSMYEGFGLPPVEAMAMSTPAIVSNSSCLPETTQGAAMLIDPRDLESFADAIGLALHDEKWRAQAIMRGKAVAESYDWDQCVTRTIEVYRRCSV